MQAAASPLAGAESASAAPALSVERGLSCEVVQSWGGAGDASGVRVREGRQEESGAELSISQHHCLGNKARLRSSVQAKQAVLLAGVTAAWIEGSGLGALFL